MPVRRYTVSTQFSVSGNIAYQKKTELSQTSNNPTRPASAGRSVDGDTSFRNPPRDCALAESDRLPTETAWWLIELGNVHIIEGVIIYSKNGAYS